MKAFTIYFLVCVALLTTLSAQASDKVPLTRTQGGTHLAEGDAYLAKDRVEDAIRAYKLAIKEAPASSQAHTKLANAYALQGNVSSAVREDNLALKLDPKNARAHQHLGWLMGISNRYADAILEEKTAIMLAPGYQPAYAILGMALAECNQYEAAITALEKAIRLDKRDYQSYLNLAAVLGKKGDYAGSINLYKKVLSVRPNSVQSHLGLGAAYGKLNNSKAEISEFEKAVALAPNIAITHMYLGTALIKSGHTRAGMWQSTIANGIRLKTALLQAASNIVTGWAGLFIVLGVAFAILFAGSRFTPLAEEKVTRSFFLTFYKDKPGRFVITSKRLIFAPDIISEWFGGTRVSIQRDQITKVDSLSTAYGGTLTVNTADGSARSFKMPNFVLDPLLKTLEKEGVAV